LATICVTNVSLTVSGSPITGIDALSITAYPASSRKRWLLPPICVKRYSEPETWPAVEVSETSFGYAQMKSGQPRARDIIRRQVHRRRQGRAVVARVGDDLALDLAQLGQGIGEGCQGCPLARS
jgi:hypothetical protein